jgi:hypothetical protein
MNNAATITSRATATTANELFAAVVMDASNCGCIDSVLDAIEVEAQLTKRSDETRAAVIDAALSFVHGLDYTAVKTLIEAEIHGAERIVRRMRVQVADNAQKFNLPARG